MCQLSPTTLIWISRLTAFVVKAFVQAGDDIFIDPDIIASAIRFLLHQQNEDGSFQEPGMVLHKELQVHHCILFLSKRFGIYILNNWISWTQQNINVFSFFIEFFFRTLINLDLWKLDPREKYLDMFHLSLYSICFYVFNCFVCSYMWTSTPRYILINNVYRTAVYFG